MSEKEQEAIAYFKENQFEATEDVYQEALDYMAECLEDLEPPNALDSSLNTTAARLDQTAFSLNHLPPIQLPPFDGKYEEWEHFRDRFNALIIGNKDLRDFARMHYLTSCLKGSALDCIKDIPVTASNFEIAWTTLSARYDDKRRLLGVHLATLLSMSSVSRESAADLRSLIDTFKVTVSSLSHLDWTPADLWQDMLVHLVTQKLDPVTRKAWNIKSSDGNAPPSVEDLVRFITVRVRALEEFAAATTSKASSKPSSNAKVHTATASAASASSSACPVCKARHYFSACPSFVCSGLNQRRDLVKKHNRCYNCLSQSHSVRECRSKHSCRLCSKRHHTMLHENSDPRAGSAAPAPTASDPPPTSENSQVQALNASTVIPLRRRVLLATAFVTLRSSSGRSAKVRAFLDQGSEMTFISESVAQTLRLQRLRGSVGVSAVGGIRAGTVRHSANITISPRHAATPTVKTSALILKKLTTYAPKRGTDVSLLDYLRDLDLADPEPANAAPIQMIIGADLYPEIILEGLRKGKPGEPLAQRIIFGWILSGPLDADGIEAPPSLSGDQPGSPRPVSMHHSSYAEHLDLDLKRFWELEETPRRFTPSNADEKCEQHFMRTTADISYDYPLRRNRPLPSANLAIVLRGISRR